MVGSELCRVAFCQRTDQFIVKVVKLRSDAGSHALFVHLPTAVDILFKAIIQIAASSTIRDFLLVVKFYLADQQSCEPACIVVRLFLFPKSGTGYRYPRVRSWRRRDGLTCRPEVSRRL